MQYHIIWTQMYCTSSWFKPVCLQFCCSLTMQEVHFYFRFMGHACLSLLYTLRLVHISISTPKLSIIAICSGLYKTFIHLYTPCWKGPVTCFCLRRLCLRTPTFCVGLFYISSKDILINNFDQPLAKINT